MQNLLKSIFYDKIRGSNPVSHEKKKKKMHGFEIIFPDMPHALHELAQERAVRCPTSTRKRTCILFLNLIKTDSSKFDMPPVRRPSGSGPGLNL